MRKVLSVIGAIWIILSYTLVGGGLLWAPLSGTKRRRLQSRLMNLSCRIFLQVLGIRITSWFYNSERFELGKKGRLIVANHVSTLDVIILSARSPCIFTTSVEIEETPVLGFWSRCAGTIFVERRHRDRLAEDNRKIQAVLDDGFDVVVFPEGTSTNGSEIKRFKQGLFQAVLATGTHVEPICIQYRTLGGKPVTPENRDRLFYYGDHEIQNHLTQIFSNEEAEVRLTVLPSIPASDFQVAADLANFSRDQICKYYQPISSNFNDTTVHAPVSGNAHA